MPNKRIAVLGAGTMGAGIAQLLAQSGYNVLLQDINDEFVQRGLQNIEQSWDKRVSQGKMSQEDKAAALERITLTTNRDDAASCHIIIEAAPEDLALKREIFAALGNQANGRTILASNTSSLSITSIASATKDPSRVVGMHFFNPAPAMPLVELIAGAQTSPEVLQTCYDLARDLGKTPIRAADMPGFVVNRVARPFYGEALKMLGEGTATVSQVDDSMRAAGFKMGPFELMDLIGIDINFAVTKSVYEAFFGEPRFRPHPIQQRMVEAGTIGRKSGSGFYVYTNGGEKGDVAVQHFAPLGHLRRHPHVPLELTADFMRRANIHLPATGDAQPEIVARILSMIINEAAFAVGEGVASVRDVDLAMKLGTNYPQGPLKWADQIGLDLVFSVLQSLHATYGEERYRPAPLLWQLVSSGAIGDVVGTGFHMPGEKGMV